MKTSHDLEASLQRIRAERAAATAKPQPRAFSRLHAIGLGLGLLMGGGAFLHGAQTPSNTLPATPVVVSEPATPAHQPAPPKEPQFPLLELSRDLGTNAAAIVQYDYSKYSRQGLSHEEALCLAKDDYYYAPWSYKTSDDPLAESPEARARMQRDAAQSEERRQKCKPA